MQRLRWTRVVRTLNNRTQIRKLIVGSLLRLATDQTLPALPRFLSVIVCKRNLVKCEPFLMIWLVGTAPNNTAVRHYRSINTGENSLRESRSCSSDVTAQALSSNISRDRKSKPDVFRMFVGPPKNIKIGTFRGTCVYCAIFIGILWCTLEPLRPHAHWNEHTLSILLFIRRCACFFFRNPHPKLSPVGRG